MKKKLKYSWRRIRKWLKPNQDPVEYAQLAQYLEKMLQFEDIGLHKVYFADESGFSLEPTVPYGWQPCGKHTAIVPKKSKKRNIFGLFRRNNEFEAYEATGSINAKLLVAFIDDFAKGVKEKSIVVIDNAPFHHAKIVKDKMEEWAKQNVFIWFLPSYSPHLNKIETLWRKIKYEWLKPHDYLDLDTFNKALDHVLNNIGSKFKIEFT